MPFNSSVIFGNPFEADLPGWEIYDDMGLQIRHEGKKGKSICFIMLPFGGETRGCKILIF